MTPSVIVLKESQIWMILKERHYDMSQYLTNVDVSSNINMEMSTMVYGRIHPYTFTLLPPCLSCWTTHASAYLFLGQRHAKAAFI